MHLTHRPRDAFCDELGDTLELLARRLDALLVGGDAPERADELRHLRLLTTDALHTLRLVATTGERATGPGLGRALGRLADDFAAATGTCADVRVRGDGARVGPGVADLVLDVARQTLATVTRPARASFVVVVLDVGDEAAELDIVDDGVGLAQRRALGRRSAVDLDLRRLAQAARAVGGRLSAVPMQPRGLRVHLSAPLAAGGRG